VGRAGPLGGRQRRILCGAKSVAPVAQSLDVV
jgi:hypothetical protein